jgi:lipopolysaccharide biosynthesis glycosyltransferase
MKICIAFGPTWAKHIPTQLYAILKRNVVSDIYLMSENLPADVAKEIQIIREECGKNIHYVDVKPFYDRQMKSSANVDSRFTKYTLFRLAIPWLIKEDKLLYLDGDTLVQGDLQELWDTEFGDALIIGCKDTGITDHHKRKIGGKAESLYLNAGVLLMDLKGLRSTGKSAKWVQMAKSKHYPAHDQDIIHLTVTPHFKEVDPKWNTSLSTSLEVLDIRIMHYAGVKSPWIDKLPNFNLWEDESAKYNAWLSEKQIERRPKPKINKIIAYGWFGGAEKPPKIKACIDSWKKFCPDYEIIELNETNCNIKENEFVRVAYDSKKWAFVSDYFRMKAMYHLGCISLDADVELLKPLDDFLHHPFFSGQEVPDKILITATMGAEKSNPVVGMILEYYKMATFGAHTKPNTQFISQIFQSLISHKVGSEIHLIGGGVLYPKEYFCNYDHKNFKVIPSSVSYSVHHFQSSWKK